MEKTSAKTIVFITGLFVNNNCWDEWINYFEQRGFTCVAPAHPHKNESTQVLRSRHPNQKVASVSLQRLVAHYTDFVKSLPENPILIGHCLGGLIVQILLQKNLGAAGIAIHPAPSQGIIPLSLSSLKASWGPLGLFTPKNHTFLMSLHQWQYAFTNGMPLSEQRKSYYQYVVPESKKAFRGVMSEAAKINFSQVQLPILLMAGGKDHISPPSISRRSFRKYRRNNSLADYKEFEDRNHFVLNAPKWQENAEYIYQWIQGLVKN